ncbi:hypothetical protein T265_15740, partial [Opisthorchis viverrini]
SCLAYTSWPHSVDIATEAHQIPVVKKSAITGSDVPTVVRKVLFYIALNYKASHIVSPLQETSPIFEASSSLQAVIANTLRNPISEFGLFFASREQTNNQ